MKIRSTVYAQEVFRTPSVDSSVWFGYYNYDTLNSDQTKMLVNRSNVDGVAPEKDIVIELGYYDLRTGEWNKIGETDSWNWQQGAMLQWMPGKGNESKVIYNLSKNGHLISRIHNIDTNEDRDLDWSIYGITPDGMKSIAIEMERSYWCRAYHYQSVANPDQEGNIVETDGIFEVDLINNTRRRIISILDIIATDSNPEFKEMKHWLEHVMINQSGTKFCFLHRFSPSDKPMMYQTRLCIADIDGTNLQVIPDWRKFDWSHFGWNEDAFSIYTVPMNKLGSSFKSMGQRASKNNPLKKLLFSIITKIKKKVPAKYRKQLKGGKSYYQYYKMSEECFKLAETWDYPLFSIDGHPSFTNDRRYMITDSYPDATGYQRLVVFDTVTHKSLLIAQLYAYYKGNPASCDLHPKLCKDNNYVVVDTAYDEKHHMIVFKLDWNKIKQELS